MSLVRFVVSVDHNGLVTYTCPQTGDTAPARTMRRLPDANGYFPQPPERETCQMPESARPSCKQLCLDSDPAALRRERRRVEDRELAEDEGAQRFGAYLFHTLIGRVAWEWMTDVATRQQAKCVELALTFPADDASLQRLNWEMMHTGADFLAARAVGLPVAITRLVPDTRGTRWKPRLILGPPRVLFVVGTSLNDATIRPAAEFLGLMRELKANGRGLVTQVLENATSTDFDRAVRNFTPDIVHFACHGDWDRASGKGYLELAVEEPGRDNRMFADQLMQAFAGGDDRKPPLIVLSACRSGYAENPFGEPGTYELAPLAVELVQQGVPMVVGMAGRVSDAACRLFTRRFNAALVDGESLVAAAAEARRAVALTTSIQTSADWAFPALFLAEEAEVGYRPVEPRSGPGPYTPETLISGYRIDLSPIFCGRTEFLEAYRDFYRSGGKQVLVVVGQPDPGEDADDTSRQVAGYWKVGKTRLLQELAAQALRDGHVPVLLASNDPDWKPPRSLKDLCVELRAAIKVAREALNLGIPGVDQLRLLKVAVERLAQGAGLEFLDSGPFRELDPAIRFELEFDTAITPTTLSAAARTDLVLLAKDARASHDHVRRAEGRALVLFDSVDRYEPDILGDLLRRMIDATGLGRPEETVPVVLTLAHNPGGPPLLIDLMDYLAKSNWVESLTLRPFDTKANEDLYAYNQFILNPFTRMHRANGSDRRHVVNDRASADVAAMARALMRTEFGGVPGRMADVRNLYRVTATLKSGRYVRELTTIEDEDQALKRARIDWTT